MIERYRTFYDDYDKGTWFVGRVDDEGHLSGDPVVDGLSGRQAGAVAAALGDLAVERDAANEDAERLAEAMTAWTALRDGTMAPQYTGAVMRKVNAALAAHRARVDEPTDA